MPVELGSIVEGIITGITNFGAFVELPDGEIGLVHISEIAEAYVKDINEFLKNNERVTVKVISLDSKGKIGLSIKQARSSCLRPGKNKPSSSFEEKLARFLKESEERQQELKRNVALRRGNKGFSRKFE